MKSFRKIFDFKGNRIKNVKVDLPTKDEDPASKKYVDTTTVYSSTKASKYKNPFNFDWMKNIFDKPHNEVLDELLYPRVLPKYYEPTIICDLILLEDKPINVLNATTFNLKFKIVRNDRDLVSAVKVIIDYDGLPQTIVTDTSINYESNFVISAILDKIISIKLVTVFSAASERKLDTYDDEYIDPEFLVQKTINTELELPNKDSLDYIKIVSKIGEPSDIQTLYDSLSNEGIDELINAGFQSNQYNSYANFQDIETNVGLEILIAIPDGFNNHSLVISTYNTANEFLLHDLITNCDNKILGDLYLIKIPYIVQKSPNNLLHFKIQ